MEVFHYPIGAKIPGTSYRVLDRLAAGGMGAVYEVLDENLDKRLILKTILASLARRDDLVARIRREAKALAKLTHPNIVQIFRFDETEDSLRTPYLVMERLEGESLRSYLERDGKMPWREATEVVVEVLAALEHSHTHGIIHRDVKPENIFLHRDHAGRPIAKLIDFGIVSVPNPETQRLTSDRFIGTLGYAAPEQILGETATPLVDVYAAGLVFYEMITGRNPFDELDVVASIARARVERVPESVDVEGLPEGLGPLILSSFRNDRALRPASAAEFAARIRAIVPTLTDHGVGGVKVAAVTHAGGSRDEWASRGTVKLLVGVLTAGILLGGVLPIGKNILRARRRAAEANVAREVDWNAPKTASARESVPPPTTDPKIGEEPAASASASSPGIVPSTPRTDAQATTHGEKGVAPPQTTTTSKALPPSVHTARRETTKSKTRLPGAGL